ncbi:MAG: GTPase ObgE [Flavobacteriaceae bacterium]|nr:GTPase ObgE [Flavobacteriaceae bacterium]MCY4253351.1 GTPase ObgE [Flavobacteriaceae bacterium]
MIKGNFVDYVHINVQSGNGGNGSTHFRREKFIPKGGPDGGDGGRGGHVYIKANKHIWTLYPFKFKKHFKAQHGDHGSGKKKTGQQGQDLTIEVPMGTIVRSKENHQTVLDISKENQLEILVHGGRGGKGNWHFRTSVNQSPKYAQQGEKGQEKQYILELKVLADVGLVGLPNAGKSTLLSKLTKAKPKIADYEFTTLKPNLGIVPYKEHHSFVMADIPGIIQGASNGKGLGHHFLRHIERNSILLYLISLESQNVVQVFNDLTHELKQYNKELTDKSQAVVLTKSDLLAPDEYSQILKSFQLKFPDMPSLVISSHLNYNLGVLKEIMWQLLQYSQPKQAQKQHINCDNGDLFSKKQYQPI